MFQVVQQNKEEEIAMYMKSSKRKLIAMLMENQRILRDLTGLQQEPSHGQVVQENTTNSYVPGGVTWPRKTLRTC